MKEKGRVKGAQIGSSLMHITIKEAKVVIARPWGIPQAFSISEIVVEAGGEETLKGFHGKGPFSSDRHGCGGTFGSSGCCHGPASL
jgi:hypothetical protein